MQAALQQHEGIGPATAGRAGNRRHRPEDTVLYGVVEQQADAFFEGQGERGSALPRFVRRSFKRTCVADGWNMVSFEQNARGVGTSIGWRLAANAVVGAHRARRGAWPRAHLVRYHGLFAPNAHGCAGAAKHKDVQERPMQASERASCRARPRV